MVQPLPSSSCSLDLLPHAPNPAPRRAAAAPLILPARRSLEARRHSRPAAFLSAIRLEHLGAAFTLLILFGALAAMGWRVASGLRAPAAVRAASVTIRVRPGDTLWSVARRHGPAGLDTPARMDALLRINHLPNDAVLVPGQTLRVPNAGRL